jgi:VCBS repeat-containing protein
VSVLANDEDEDGDTLTVTGASDTATVEITIAPVNDPPVPVDDFASVDEDGSVDIDVTLNDIDVDSTILQLKNIGFASNGVVTKSGNIVTYMPNPDFFGTDTFTYNIDDELIGNTSGLATVTVTVNPVNDPPVAVDDGATTNEDTAVVIDLLANDSDVDGDSLNVTVIGAASNGTVVDNGDGTVTYTPDPDYNGPDSFTYTVSDGTVTDTATVNVTVDPVNDPPVAVDDGATTNEDTAVVINVLANDSDVDGDTLTITAVGTAGNGTVVDNGDGTVTYTPDPDYNGPDSFTYTVSDGTVTDTATVNVTVNPVNDPPVAVDDGYATSFETTLNVAAVAGVLDNDTDVEGDALTAVLQDDVTNGTLTLNSDGSFDYTPDAGFSGTDSFTYFANDGTENGLTPATVTITVNAATNTPPVAVDDGATTNEDTAVVIDLLANDSDVDGDSLNVTVIGAASNGTVVDNGDGTVTYTPDPDYNGPDSFTYTVSDGTVTDTATVNVTVDPVNDPPVAVDDGATTNEDTAVVINVLANDSDVDGDTLTITAVGTAGNGTVVDNGDGTVTYTPDPDYNGPDSFTYTVSDGTVTDTATVNVTVNPVNDPPVAVDDGYATSFETTLNVAAVAGVLDNDTDVEGDALTAVLQDDVTNGTLTLNSDGSFDYTPDAGFSGTDSFTYFANDGTENGLTPATVTITVNAATNTPPVAVDDGATTNEDTAVVIDLLANDSDVDGDSLNVTVIGAASNGTVVDNGDGTVTYTPDPDYNGPDSFTYTVSDGTVTDTATVNVTVDPVNDPPVAVDDGATTNEDTAVVINVLANDSDVDGDTLTITAVGTAGNGTVVDNGDGTVTYTPDPDYNGPDSFTYTVSDGTVTDTATVNVTVNPVNDPPVAVDDGYATSFETTLNVAAVAGVLDNDTDVEGDALTAVLQDDVTNGTLTLNSDGSFDYTPDAGFSGTDSFTYFANDGTENGLTPATVTITVGSQPPPDPTELTFNGSTYLILQDGLSRAEAEAQAAALGGTLLRIDSQAEQDWVTANIWNQQAIYLDASDAATEGVWVDSDGTPLAYTNWMPGEPNDGGGNQDYALLASSDGGWDDQGRDGSDIFTDRWFGTAAMSVVEIVGGDPPPDTGGDPPPDTGGDPPPDTGGDPPPDGGDPPPAGLTFGGSTYVILDDGLSRAEAQAQAAALGGTLLRIGSQAEQDWVMANIWDQQAIYLDASDAATEGVWVDSDGTPLAYTNWMPGEPNDGGGNQDYALLASSDGGWDDQGRDGSDIFTDRWFGTAAMSVVEIVGGDPPPDTGGDPPPDGPAARHGG